MSFKIVHTSPNIITSIDPLYGPFEGVLFFSHTEYSMSRSVCKYTLTVNDDQFISPFDLEPNQEEVNQTLEAFSYLDLDEGTLVDEHITEDEPAYLDAEFSWYIQALQARIARRMGFLGVESIDEQGTVYAICFRGRHELLPKPQVLS